MTVPSTDKARLSGHIRTPLRHTQLRRPRRPKLFLPVFVLLFLPFFLVARFRLSLCSALEDAVVALDVLFDKVLTLSTLNNKGQRACSVQDLSLADWTVSSSDKNISVPAELPSQVHLDLFAAGIIEDPYRNLNDFDLRWILYSNWTYATRLSPRCSRKRAKTWLIFDGLDTFASISLCGKHVAATNNQFRQYFFDVSQILRSCKAIPELSINFGSAINISNTIAAQPGQETWPYPLQGTFEFPNRWFIRKEQSDFGWDWGPAFAPAGPWQPARMVTLGKHEVHIRNTLVDVYREGQLPLIPPDQSKPWVLNVSLDIIGDVPPNAGLKYTLRDHNKMTVRSGQLEVSQSPEGTITGSASIPDEAVQLWWPVNMGPQTLYDLQIDVTKTSNKASITKGVGFRTIVQNALPVSQIDLDRGVAPGNNWHFEVNGQPFYAKGSNFIPPDAFWPRVTPERIHKLFDAVVLGNQNMLRVWSSGAYSPDFMFGLADEIGILLWSEFQFGDALYPVNDEFIENVKEEVYYQVRRCNHHPSLAYWAGGNELENVELSKIPQIDPEHYGKYLAEYEYLFLDTIVPILFEHSRSISYSPSSTNNGWLNLNFSKPQPITERYNNKTRGSIYGETDYYNYDSSFAFNLSSYPVGRFSNEFGYHSMPSIHSWRQAVDEEHLHFNSSIITLRNHHYPAGSPATDNFANATKGMMEMTLAVQRWFPTPNKRYDAIQNFTSWCHATQLFQAAFYKAQIEFYRRGSGMPQRTLGSLYWQLEDIWQAPTWAGIEYDGRWKVLHYTAMKAYRSVIVAGYFDADTGVLDVYVTSDLWTEARGRVSFDWFDWRGDVLDMDAPAGADFTVGALNTTRVLAVNVTELLKGRSASDTLLRMSVSATGSLPNSGGRRSTFTHEDWFHPAPLSSAALVDPGLRYSWVAGEEGVEKEVLVVTATSGVSAWIWVEHPPGVTVAFDDNGFWLRKGEARRLRVLKMWNDETGGKWKEGVKVESVWDLTQP